MTQKRSYEVDDLYEFRQVEEVHSVRDLDVAACAVTWADRGDDAYRSCIWLVPLTGDPPLQLTPGTFRDKQPRWAPDRRRLGFISDRSGGTPQAFIIARDGGEARVATDLPNGVVAFEWSPDGERLIVLGTLKVDPEARGQRSDPPQGDAGPQVVWRLPYKSDGMGYLLDRETHLFIVDVATGKREQLTDGPFDVRSAQASPDGRRIAYTRTRGGRFAHRTDVWVMDADGANARQLSHDIASVQYPKWSPDGRSIAFTGSEEEGDSQMRPWVVDVDQGTIRPIGAESLEVLSGEDVYWNGDGSSLTMIVVRNGRSQIARLTVPEGHCTALVTGDRHVMNLGLNDRLAFVSAKLDEPSDVYVADLDGTGEKRLTDFNAWTRERAAPQVECRRFAVPDGKGGTETIDGWLIRGPDADGASPLLVDVHGGPQSYVDFDYTRHVYWPVLWSRGWSILALNAVGSSSYGHEFARRLRKRWGELDLPQHLAAIEALQREGIADERVAITGKSYGGYLSAWAISKTKVFKAAVVSAPVTNIDSHFGTSDSGYYVTPYAMAGEPELDRQTSRRLSPMETAHEASTPTLILQGKDDERCPICQAEELYVTLTRNPDLPVEMVLYPGGSHHLAEQGQPSFRRDYHQRLVDWIERWANGAEHDTGTQGARDAQRSADGDDQRGRRDSNAEREVEPAPANEQG